jgi:RNA polymerase sigma-70 factor, ECF subfamily
VCPEGADARSPSAPSAPLTSPAGPTPAKSMSPTPTPTDRELVDRARAGDTRAFGQLVRRHQQRIHRLAMHLVRNRAEAEDVMQETFIRAYRALGGFDGRSEPYTWLYRIAINLSLNVLRARRAQRVTSHGNDFDSGHSQHPRLEEAVASARAGHGEVAGPSADAARQQLYRALSRGIDELSETLRTTLVLVCIDGRSHEEAAAILGAPEGTIAWRIHEARRKLREHMAKLGFGPEETWTE